MPDVTVIGGANLDITGFPDGHLDDGVSNPGKIKLSAGGVARNIAENLARLGVSTALLSRVGDDLHGWKILSECEQAGVDVSGVEVVQGRPSSSYLSILDQHGDLQTAVSQMELIDEIGDAFLSARSNHLDKAKLIVADANLSRPTLGTLLATYDDRPVFLEAVSKAKAERLRDDVGRAHTLKANREEAEILAGMDVVAETDLGEVTRRLLDSGLEQIFLTLGEDGLYFANRQHHGRLPAPEVEIVNVNGSGDAMLAAIVCCHLDGRTLEATARFAQAAAALTLACEGTTSSELTRTRVEQQMAIPARMEAC